MKLVKAVLLSLALLGATAPGIAQARGGHGGHFGGFGWGFGLGALITAPLIAGSYYASPYYAQPYYPPPYAYPPNYGYAPTYVQPAYAPQYQAPVQQQTNAWFFCPSSNGYYPYVRQCPDGWQRVSPTPPGN